VEKQGTSMDRPSPISTGKDGGASAVGSDDARRIEVDPDGTIHVPAFDLPLSAAISPEARQSQILMMSKPGIGLPSFDGINTEAEFVEYVEMFRKNLDAGFIVPLSQAILSQFPVGLRAYEIAGVPVEEFAPEACADDRRVLINLHGGAFMSGAIHIGRVESAPVASIGKVKVISVNYRQGYEHKFPAASEDVAAVYRELLKSYPAGNIGIYGCSAGGALTAQVMAWLIHKGFPAPGAIGIFSAGAGGGGGDSAFFGQIGTAQAPPPASAAADPLAGVRYGKFGYLSDVTPDDYLAMPLSAPRDVLAKYPPTLLISATRAFDMSPAIAFHRALTRAGVDASLQIFDGLGHCFYYSASTPEALDAYDTITRFFDRHLGKAVGGGS
jgi:acetyl esterase/lipase